MSAIEIEETFSCCATIGFKKVNSKCRHRVVIMNDNR